MEKDTPLPSSQDPIHTASPKVADCQTEIVSPAEAIVLSQEAERDEREAETWKYPRINLWRYLVTLFCFVLMGANDASLGALLPSIEKYYGINYTTVATMFLCPVVGYTIAALLINRLHMRWGQLCIAIAAPICKIVAYIVCSVHPPFPVLPVIFSLTGIGNGLEDGSWNAWVGGLDNPNELLGLLHGAYGLGAAIGPLVSTTMITKGGLEWYTFYYIMVGGVALELLCASLAFRHANGAAFRATHPAHAGGKSNTGEALRHRVTWIMAAFLLCYVGVEVSLGGWLVTFMLAVRGGAAFGSGLVATGFWLGLTAGRVALGFVTGRLGEKPAIAAYLALAAAVELLFWLVPSFVASAVAAAFLGFFLGPLFPAAIVVLTKTLPVRLHVSAVGFAAAIGSAGAAVMPFIVGAIAQAKGVQVLEPIALALILAIFLLWCVLPGGFRRDGLDRVQKEVQAATAAEAARATGTGVDQA